MRSAYDSLPLRPTMNTDDLKSTIQRMKEDDQRGYEQFLNFFNTFEPNLTKKCTKDSNPAAVGLAGFGAAIIMLQLTHMGLVNPGPMISLSIMLGGVLQIIAGIHEFKTGNNFAYSMFHAFGATWICLGLIPLGQMLNVYKATGTDIGVLLIVFTLFTAMFVYPAANHNMAMFLLFVDLELSFIVTDISHFIDQPAARNVELAGCILFIISGAIAWYVVAHILFLDAFQKDLLPLGTAPLKMMHRRSYTTNNQSSTTPTMITVMK